jgi:hypothetical protein
MSTEVSRFSAGLCPESEHANIVKRNRPAVRDKTTLNADSEKLL